MDDGMLPLVLGLMVFAFRREGREYLSEQMPIGWEPASDSVRFCGSPSRCRAPIRN